MKYVLLISLLIIPFILILQSNTIKNVVLSYLLVNLSLDQSSQQQEHKIIAKASFLIYVNGFQLTFSDSDYHNASSEVYINEVNPSIVYVEKPYATWNDFFTSLPIVLNENCFISINQQDFCSSAYKELVFTLNGERIEDLFERTIHDGDRLLVSYGNIDQPQRLFKEYRSVPLP